VKQDEAAYARATVETVKTAFNRYHRPDRVIRVLVKPAVEPSKAQSAESATPVS
jgi:hypothetical protein